MQAGKRVGIADQKGNFVIGGLLSIEFIEV